MPAPAVKPGEERFWKKAKEIALARLKSKADPDSDAANDAIEKADLWGFVMDRFKKIKSGEIEMKGESVKTDARSLVEKVLSGDDPKGVAQEAYGFASGRMDEAKSYLEKRLGARVYDTVLEWLRDITLEYTGRISLEDLQRALKRDRRVRGLSWEALLSEIEWGIAQGDAYPLTIEWGPGKKSLINYAQVESEER